MPWEKQFTCLRRAVATLQGYQRVFNKASTRNRGTRETPCPTLNLEKVQNGVCKGMAFAFPKDDENEVRKYLHQREGKDFVLQRLMIRLDDASEVIGYVPVYQGENIVSASTLDERALMVNRASGRLSSCRDYVRQ